jgi:hypothetical protein
MIARFHLAREGAGANTDLPIHFADRRLFDPLAVSRQVSSRPRSRFGAATANVGHVHLRSRTAALGSEFGVVEVIRALVLYMDLAFAPLPASTSLPGSDQRCQAADRQSRCNGRRRRACCDEPRLA